MKNNSKTIYDQNTNYINLLSILVSLLPLSMVIGAAIMEIIILCSCIVFFFLNFKKIGLEYYKNNFFILFLFFNFFLIISSILSENILNSIRNTAFYFRFGILVIIIWFLLDYYKKFKKLFFYSILITLLLIILFTLIQLTFFPKTIIYSNRISGIFNAESVQGSFLLRITPIFIVFYVYCKHQINKNLIFLYYFTLISVFVLVVLSGERAAIFLMFVGIGLLYLFFKINIKKLFFYSLSLLTFFFIILQLNPEIKERVIYRTFNDVFVKSQNTEFSNFKRINIFSEGHQDHIETGIMIFKRHYIKGVGVRNFRSECKKNIYKKNGKYYCTTHPHNTYVQLLSETGLIGCFFFIIFLFFIYSKVYESLKQSYTKNIKIRPSYAFVLTIILVNFFPFVPTGSFFNNWLSTLYYLPLGLLFHELNLKKIL